jgi:two-component system, chemotaxis family, chemotaxis protein CheY
MKTVIVMDDSRAMRMILKKIMIDLGFEVMEAGNGLEGLDLLKQGDKPDLVLVDWNMPEMNGHDFVKAVRARPEFKGLRLLVVSSETQAEGVELMYDAGADGYVAKPFSKDVLKEKLSFIGLGGNPNA